MHTYDYPRPALTVDAVILSGGREDLRVLLIRRGAEPFAGEWALPGGFVNELEPLELAARRELAEETGLRIETPLEHVGTFGDPGRDPRGWVVTAAFGALMPGRPPAVRAGDDAAGAAWHRVSGLPPLASDHAIIVRVAVDRLARW